MSCLVRLIMVPLIVIVTPLFLTGIQRSAEPQAPKLAASIFLEPKLQVGQKLGNVFSRTVSYKAEGIDEVVRRTSGTGIYVVTANSPAGTALDGQFRYDGIPEFKAKAEIKDGGRTVCYDGKCSAATDASGVLYNPLLWGDPKGSIHNGLSWDVSIAEPWELGPPGKETVTVIEVEPGDHSATLKREGAGEGYFANDSKQIHISKDGKSYLVDVNPGRAHWIGYTRFREGIVMSDELLVDRPVTLTSKEMGNIAAQERQYILLNATPAPQ